LFQAKPHFIFEPFASERNHTACNYTSIIWVAFFKNIKKVPNTATGHAMWNIRLTDFREKSEVHNPKAQKAPTLSLHILAPKGVVADQPQVLPLPRKCHKKRRIWAKKKV